ncbi:MAG: HD domain-containing protein [Gemmatimonadetes bacterium]|nr:HD domain-containing protein [Gemmatimonadota bacterium]
MADLEHAGRSLLIQMTKALSALSLYESGHPQREKAVDAFFLAFTDMEPLSDSPEFTFLDGEVALDGISLPSLRGWEWGLKLEAIGMERLAIEGNASREDLVGFLEFTMHRLQGIASGAQMPGTVHFGPVQVRQEGDGAPYLDSWSDVTTEGEAFSVEEEVGLLDEAFSRARSDSSIHIAEVTAVVESLVAAMATSQEALLPLIRLKTHDQYTATHSINVSVLSMALAEHVGLGAEDVRLIGIGGVLHDIGKTRIPKEILNKPGKLTDEEFAIIRSHPSEGAKLIMESERSMELAAIMAYEHHIRFDGGGYPAFKFKRKCHVASDLLHVCDVYDALATNRPYRDGWDSERILTYLSEGAGTEFAPEMVRAFVTMMHSGGRQVRVVDQLAAPAAV